MSKLLTKDRWLKIKEEQEKLIQKFDIFEAGVSFPEKYAKAEECTRTSWLGVFTGAIYKFDLENCKIFGKEITNLSDFEFGVLLEKYFSYMENIIIKEFSTIIDPFKDMISEYRTETVKILNS